MDLGGLSPTIIGDGLLAYIQERSGYHFHDISILRQALSHMADWAKAGDATIKAQLQRHLLLWTNLSLREKTAIQFECEGNELFNKLVGQMGLTNRLRQAVVDNHDYKGPATFFEALVQAILEDGGYETAYQFLERILFPHIQLPEDTVGELMTFCCALGLEQRIALRRLKPWRKTRTLTLHRAHVCLDGKVIVNVTHKNPDEAVRRAAAYALRDLPTLLAIPS